MTGKAKNQSIKIKCPLIFIVEPWNNDDILRYIRKNIPGYKINHCYEGGCLPCGTDLQFWPNNLSRLYETDHKKWKFYMDTGMGENILIANGIDPGKYKYIVKNRPEALLRIVR